jgi:hypothetical protein
MKYKLLVLFCILCISAKSQTLAIRSGIDAFSKVEFAYMEFFTFERQLTKGVFVGLTYDQPLSNRLSLSAGFDVAQHRSNRPAHVIYWEYGLPDTMLATNYSIYFLRFPVSMHGNMNLSKSKRLVLSPSIGLIFQKNVFNRSTTVETGLTENVKAVRGVQTYASLALQLKYSIASNLNVAVGSSVYSNVFGIYALDNTGLIDGHSTYLSAGWTFDKKAR